MDLESLASLRRSFHTLKGSGRMVGRALDRGIRMVDRESAEPHHRQDAVAHAGDDDPAAQRRRRAAAAGGAAGERRTDRGAAVECASWRAHSPTPTAGERRPGWRRVPRATATRPSPAWPDAAPTAAPASPRGTCRTAAPPHGSAAARDLQQGDLEPSWRKSAIICASAAGQPGAARSAGVGVPRHPHV